ncbi:hypothetical protein ACIBG0_32295 [Nocardia sp. NPDC050630]|uniref:hypothetical protein n=1 Tax=Nocardia sp. NPDC050630 TaxID=3364321 RepID=UPI0037A4110A
MQSEPVQRLSRHPNIDPTVPMTIGPTPQRISSAAKRHPVDAAVKRARPPTDSDYP